MVDDSDDDDDNHDVTVLGSIEYINRELNRTERQLTQQQQIDDVQLNNNSNNNNNNAPSEQSSATTDGDNNHKKTSSSKTTRLHQLMNEVDEMSVVYELTTTTDYVTKTNEAVIIPPNNNSSDDGNDDDLLLLHDFQRLDILSKFLMASQLHQQSPMNRMIRTLYEHEYIPLHQYLLTNCLASIRNQLHRINYPAIAVGEEGEGVATPDERQYSGDGTENDNIHRMTVIPTLDRIIQLCQSYYHQLLVVHDSVTIAVISSSSSSSSIATTTTNNNNNNKSNIDPIVYEFCRPIVQRIQYHFITTTAASTIAATGSRNRNNNDNIERLPELLFGYIREYVFDTDPDNGNPGSCRPWEMICHIHAVLSMQRQQQTSMFCTSGSGKKITLGYDFINEIIRTIQYVLSERNFFRHPAIISSSGQSSSAATTTNSILKSPIHLIKAIEQILQFDSYIQNEVLYGLINESNSATTDNDGNGLSANSTTPSTTKQLDHHHKRIIRLMDVCVVGDDELLHWWLDRERESALSTLFESTGDDEDDVNDTTTTATSSSTTPETSNVKKRHRKIKNKATTLHRISARAELFCSLLRSIQIKATIFTYTGPYYSAVAVPMCIEFLDAIHETITYMKQQLVTAGNKTKRKLPTNIQFINMIDQWIELINGTHMAATMLTTPSTTAPDDSSTESMLHFMNETNTVVNDDMLRFGRSLQHLQIVIVDDLITAITETIIMERCKFAAYLMRCSHLLSQQRPGSEVILTTDDSESMSFDLSETYRIISVLFSRCWIMKNGSKNPDATISPPDQFHLNINNFASRMIRERLLSSIAEKILEVALDIHGMTPDLNQYGCSIFAYDATELLLSTSHFDDDDDNLDTIEPASIFIPEYVLRVVDIVQLMKYDSTSLRGIGNALCGLSGQSAPLSEDVFTMDDRLYDEAICMIRAKGFIYIELSDVLTILNRRRDL